MCEELCNGFDDDRDGVIDESLTSTCAVLVRDFVSREGISGGFGRTLAGVGDIDEDGYSEVLVSATRARDERRDSEPASGEVSLVSGKTGEVVWTVRSGGDFGTTLAVGAFGEEPRASGALSELLSWCAGAPSQETSRGVGRITCLNLSGEKISQLSSDRETGLGTWLSTRSLDSGFDHLIISEPLWSELDESGVVAEDAERLGRVLSAQLIEDEIVLKHALVGSEMNQRIGERALSIPDVDDDGESDWLMTGYADDVRQVWVISGEATLSSETPDTLESSTVRRLKRFSTPDMTQNTFGETLAFGRWREGTDELMLAFGAPYIEVERDDELLKTGRIYFTSGMGEPAGTSSALISGAESRAGLGSALVNVKIGEEELLIAAGSGIVRVISLSEDKALTRQEFTLPTGVTPTLGVAPTLDDDGLLRVWVGLPELEQVYLLTLRPASDL